MIKTNLSKILHICFLMFVFNNVFAKINENFFICISNKINDHEYTKKIILVEELSEEINYIIKNQIIENIVIHELEKYFLELINFLQEIKNPKNKDIKILNQQIEKINFFIENCVKNCDSESIILIEKIKNFMVLLDIVINNKNLKLNNFKDDCEEFYESHKGLSSSLIIIAFVGIGFLVYRSGEFLIIKYGDKFLKNSIIDRLPNGKKNEEFMSTAQLFSQACEK